MEENDLRATITEVAGPNIDRLRQYATGGIAFGAAMVGVGFAFGGLPTIFQSWLFAWMFWLGVTSGSMAFLMLHHAVGGGWGYVLRRFLEAATTPRVWLTVLAMGLVAFIPPLFLKMPVLYAAPGGWAHPDAASNLVIQAKEMWLNPVAFMVRLAIYFAVWTVWSTQLHTLGRVEDEREDAGVFKRLNYLGAGGIVMYVLTTTFAVVDFVMSLEPTWFSSIIGLLFVAAQALSTLALMLVLVWVLGENRPIFDPERMRHLKMPAYFRDLGNLMLATTMLWAYTSFSQYLITYSGNTLEEVGWYVHRNRGGWWILSSALVFLHFFFPFLVLLLGSKVKRTPSRLAQIAGFIIFMRFVDLLYWVVPTFRESITMLSPSDLGAPVLLGGIWLHQWVAGLSGKSLVPLHASRVVEHLAHEHERPDAPGHSHAPGTGHGSEAPANV